MYNPALSQAIQRRPRGPFQANNAPMGFGQPTALKDQPDTNDEVYGGAARQPQTQVDPNATGQLAPAPSPTPAAAPAANPAWNTDGYAGPQYTAQHYNQNARAGWDQTKWADQNHQTPKYAVGRILDGYTPSIEGLNTAMGDIQRAYPGATFNGKDKITLPGVGTIDVLQNAGSGQNMNWWWGAEDAPGQPARPQMTVMPSALSKAVMPQAPQPQAQSDLLAALMAQLQVR